MGLITPLFVTISNKIGIAKCILISNLFNIIYAYFLLVNQNLSTNLVIFVIAMGLNGLSNPSSDALSSKYVETDHRGRFNSLYSINKTISDNVSKVYETSIQTSIQNIIKESKEDNDLLSSVGQMSLCFTEVIVFSILAILSSFIGEKVFRVIFVLSIISTIFINVNIRKYDKKTFHFSRYGCTYEEWKKGKKPTPMEELYCPWKFYDLNHNSQFYSRCKKSCEGEKFVCPSNCKYCFTFEECWKEWHKLYG